VSYSPGILRETKNKHKKKKKKKKKKKNRGTHDQRQPRQAGRANIGSIAQRGRFQLRPLHKAAAV
jgi:hypothetical protein